ncbi:MAG: hypothetical protein ACYS9X_12845 [Planctomycetota bacterium]|jgi:hypothetical protein
MGLCPKCRGEMRRGDAVCRRCGHYVPEADGGLATFAGLLADSVEWIAGAVVLLIVMVPGWLVHEERNYPGSSGGGTVVVCVLTLPLAMAGVYYLGKYCKTTTGVVRWRIAVPALALLAGAVVLLGMGIMHWLYTGVGPLDLILDQYERLAA